MKFAFDVDGVIIDPSIEIFATLSNTINSLFGQSSKLPNYPICKENLDSSLRENRRFFLDLKSAMVHINTAPNLIYWCFLYSRDALSKVRGELRTYLNTTRPRNINKWLDKYYEERQKVLFSIELSRIWLPHKEVVDFIKHHETDCFIISNRDQNSIQNLLISLGLKLLPDKIFAKEKGLDKKDKIEQIAKQSNETVSSMIAIDDNIENAMAMKNAGAVVLLASWGYNDQKARATASKKRISAIKLTDLQKIG